MAASKPSFASAIAVPATNLADRPAAIARTLTRPEVTAASAIEPWQPNTHDVNKLADELADQVARVNAGDLRRPEAMLVTQAHTLDALFATLMRRASASLPVTTWEAYMRIALKAQNQSRMSIATLGELKNPTPVAFVRQANITSGPQQVNNGVACAEKLEGRQTKLLKADDGERLDTGAASAASDTHSHLAAVAAVDGTEDGGRQGQGRAERRRVARRHAPADGGSRPGTQRAAPRAPGRARGAAVEVKR